MNGTREEEEGVRWEIGRERERENKKERDEGRDERKRKNVK
jgi:hypothetical protein